MIQIETKITWSGTEEQLQLLLDENGFTGFKPLYDEDGQPVYTVEYLKDENNEFVLDPQNEKIEVSRTPVMVEMTKEEYLSYIIKEGSIHGGGVMPMICGTTASLQEKFGSLQYNAKQMNEAMSSIINVETLITEE